MSTGRGGTAGPGRGRDSRAAEELAALLDDARIDGELADVSVTDAEIEELLSVAGALRSIPAPRPSGAFRTALRERLIEESTRRIAPGAATVSAPSLLDQLRERVLVLRRSVSMAAATAACLVLIGAVGVVAAAQHAQPDGLLYGLKQTTESLRIGLAGDEVEAGRLHLQLAERRLGEVVEGASDLRSSTLIDTLAEMDRHTELGADLLLDAYHLRGETAVLSDLVAFTQRQRAGLRGVIDDLPIETVPFAQRSLDLLDRIEEEATLVLYRGCVPCAEGASIPVGSRTDAARCCPDGARDDADGDETRVADPADEVEASDEPDEPTPSSRLRGIIPLDPDLDLTDDLDDTVEETTDELDDVVNDLTDTVDDTVDDVDDTLRDTVDDIDDTLEDLTDLLD